MSHSDLDSLQSLKRFFEEFQSTERPTGYSKSCEDIDIAVHEYDSYISGLAISCLRGQRVNVNEIDLGEEIDSQLATCYDKIQTIIQLRDQQKELAWLITQASQSE